MPSWWAAGLRGWQLRPIYRARLDTRRPRNRCAASPQTCLSTRVAEELGATIEEGLLGTLIRTNAKMTSIPGLYATGDIERAPDSVSWAAADGVTAGTSAHRALLFG
jgi:hypothetical protein